MIQTIGIRREDKNKWERRVPLVPADLAVLAKRHKVQFLVQPSPIRIFQDDEYKKAGATIAEDLDPARLVFAVKEIPTELLKKDRIYVYFSHVIKGQPYNMPMLAQLQKLGCSLIDYERIVNEKGARLIFFGIHAGYAGMVESLRALGQRFLVNGKKTALSEVRHAFEYASLEEAKKHLGDISARLDFRPLVIGVAGYGNVSRGAQEILESLSAREISPKDLAKEAAKSEKGNPTVLKVVFKEEDMALPAKAGDLFDLQDYYQHPEKYVGCFEKHLPHLDLLVNTIYWDERYPRLVTREWAKKNYTKDHQPRLQAIGDISCDVEGSIEPTLEVTTPDAPCITYDPPTDSAQAGHKGLGPVVMAVDNLPCEFSREASEWFSHVLREMIAPLSEADWSLDFDQLNLPDSLKKALIVHKGKLTPTYKYLEKHLNG